MTRVGAAAVADGGGAVIARTAVTVAGVWVAGNAADPAPRSSALNAGLVDEDVERALADHR